MGLVQLVLIRNPFLPGLNVELGVQSNSSQERVALLV
jgi:hypothetical protein